MSAHTSESSGTQDLSLSSNSQPNQFNYISFTPQTTQPTNFQNQFNLDCNIISAKPPSNPRFQPHAIPTGMYLGPKYMHGKKIVFFVAKITVTIW